MASILTRFHRGHRIVFTGTWLHSQGCEVAP